MKIKGLTEKERRDILFAVKNHSVSLASIGIKKAKENKEVKKIYRRWKNNSRSKTPELNGERKSVNLSVYLSVSNISIS